MISLKSLWEVLGLIAIAIVYDNLGLQFSLLIALAFCVFDLTRAKITSYWIPVFISLLASLKLPESDFYFYMRSFNSIERYGFTEFLILNIKSPLFYFLMWLFDTFLYSWQAVSFLLIASSNYVIYKVLERISRDETQLVLFSLLFFGFYPIYDQSNHLMRQYMASSILFALVYARRNKLRFWIAGFLSHLSFFVFVVNVFKKNHIKYIILLVPFLFISSMNEFLETFLLTRRVNIIDFRPLNNAHITFILPVIFLLKLNKKLFFYVLTIALTMILFSFNTEIVVRFWKYLVFFVPVVFIELTRYNRSLGTALIVLLIPFEFLYFIYNINNSTWTYLI